MISHFIFLVSSLKNVEFFNQTIKNFLLKFVKNIFNRALSSFTNITGTVSFLLYDLKWYMFYILASYFGFGQGGASWRAEIFWQHPAMGRGANFYTINIQTYKQRADI